MTQDKMSILVLDDEPIVCKRLRPALEKLGYEVDTFINSSEALEAIKDRTYHIVITDLKMEGLDGMGFLER
jgi:DNA-binding NtrC family response regulator